MSGLVVLASAGSAWAAGSEVPENGAIAMGRGGAVASGARDPLVIVQNTAALGALHGIQFSISSNFGFFRECFQREGTYDQSGRYAVETAGTVFNGTSTYATTGRVPYPQACKDLMPLGVTPSLALSYRVNRYVAIGAGFYPPNTTGSSGNFPDTVTATYRDPQGNTTNYQAPTPARNMLYRKSLLVGYPTLALAVTPHPYIRFGIALQPSFGFYNFTLMANTDSSTAQSPDTDLQVNLAARGFMMSGNLAVQIVPLPWFSMGFQVHYNSPLIGGTGTGTTVSNYYASTAAQRGDGSFNIVSFELQMPAVYRAGFRVNLPRPGHATQNQNERPYDPMVDDVFDAEFAYVYESTSTLGITRLSTEGEINAGTQAQPLRVPAPGAGGVPIVLDSGLRDTHSVRFGGDVNVIPGVFALRMGINADSAAMSTKGAVLHLPAFASFGVTGGFTARWRWLSVTVGYQHTFFQDFYAYNGEGRVVTGGVPLPSTSYSDCVMAATGAGPGSCSINRGTYSAQFDAASLALSGRW